MKMRLSDIEKKARNMGVKETWRFSKKDLIRAIQKKEGNIECFSTRKNDCSQLVCCWREDCLK